MVPTSQTNPVPGNGTRPDFNQLTGYGMQPSLNYQNTGRIPDQRVDIDNQFYSKPRYDPLNMIEHYGEPVPTRNANTSRNNATPPAASELSSIDNLKEKILEEVIGDVKKMNGAGGKLFNEATVSSVDIESK